MSICWRCQERAGIPQNPAARVSLQHRGLGRCSDGSAVGTGFVTHIGRWNLVERTTPDIEADVRAGAAARRRAAAPPGTVAGLGITADASGLTLFATVRRADEPG